MSLIRISHPYTIKQDDVIQHLQQLASDFESKHGLKCSWQDDRVSFSRKGVDGTITVQPSQVLIEAKLGLMASAFKPKLEAEIIKYCETHIP